MVIIRLKGGLGNQLFQYATAYAIAKENNDDLLIDDTFFEKQDLRQMKLNVLNIENKKKYPLEQKSIIVSCLNNKYLNKMFRILKIKKIRFKKDGVYYLEDRRTDYTEDIFRINSTNVYLDGYFQSYLYFEKYRQKILRQFEISFLNNGELFEKEITQTESVAIHIRRGDFLKHNKKKNTYNYVLELSYYFKAIKEIEKNIKNPTYYFFSDDINWVKKKFGEREEYIYISLTGENADVEELMLMKKCKHIIAANSTFSWWAAWLNENENAIKIVPNRDFGNHDMIPNTWIRLDYEC